MDPATVVDESRPCPSCSSPGKMEFLGVHFPGDELVSGWTIFHYSDREKKKRVYSALACFRVGMSASAS